MQMKSSRFSFVEHWDFHFHLTKISVSIHLLKIEIEKKFKKDDLFVFNNNCEKRENIMKLALVHIIYSLYSLEMTLPAIAA